MLEIRRQGVYDAQTIVNKIQKLKTVLLQFPTRTECNKHFYTSNTVKKKGKYIRVNQNGVTFIDHPTMTKVSKKS